MQDILVLLPIPALTIMAIEDIKYKAVSDDINYFYIVFTYVLFAVLHIKNIIFVNWYIIVITLLLFFVLHLVKAFAIGDMILFIWLVPYITLVGSENLILFFIFLFTIGAFMTVLFSTLHLKKSNISKYHYKISAILLAILIPLTILSLYLVYKISRNIVSMEEFYIYFYKLFAIYLMYTIVLLFYKIKLEKVIRNSLTFKRKPNELVEGDWIIEGIKVSTIPEKLHNKVKRYFKIKDTENHYILDLKYNKILGSIGLTKTQIDILKELDKYDKNDIKVTVQEGFPFIPSILLAYLLIVLIYFI